jgi:hypothetical protein
MATAKYQHLFKPLKMAEIPGLEQVFKNTGNADINRWLNGRDHLEGMELNFSWGFYTGLGDWHPGMDPHAHPYPECLVFVGLDPDRPEYLGAELQYCLGKELEIHRFNKPTCVVAPGGFLHCPSVTLDVTSPIGYSFFIISLGADPTTRWMGDNITEAQMQRMRPDPASGIRSPMNSSFGKKRIHISEDTVSHGSVNAHYIKPMIPNTMTAHPVAEEDKALYGEMLRDGREPGPGLSENAVWMFGKDLEGMDLNFCWSIHKNPGLWVRGPGRGAHVHPYDEVLVLAGTEPSDIDYLGAEIQIDMGEEHERYVVHEPTAVVLPAGMPHCPIVTRYVDKPYGVLMMSLGSTHETIYID